MVALAKRIVSAKVDMCGVELANANFLSFPICFNDVLPPLFKEVLSIYGLESSTAIGNYFKLRPLLQYKDAAQRDEVASMQQRVQDEVDGRFTNDVQHLVKLIIEADNINLHS